MVKSYRMISVIVVCFRKDMNDGMQGYMLTSQSTKAC
jgi:hypothetical protein